MTAREVVTACQAIGITLTRNGPSVHVHAPTGELPAELRAAVMANKAELLTLLPPRESPGPGWQQDWQGRWVDLTGLHLGGTALPHQLGSISKGIRQCN